LRLRALVGSVLLVAQVIPPPRRLRQAPPPRRWTFITNHAQVLLAVAQRPDLRVRQIAAAAGITERYAYRILRDLQNAGYVERRRSGRCNLYRVYPELALGDPLVEEHALWELLRLIDTGESDDFVAMAGSVGRSPTTSAPHAAPRVGAKNLFKSGLALFKT
jgi:DNA-binding transcriptional ArsR family regulator